MANTIDTSGKTPYNESNDKHKSLGISEVLEPIHSTLRELIDVESKGGHKGTYTDSDVIAVTLLYSLICGNRLLRQIEDEKVGVVMAHNISQHYTALIQAITNGMSGVDVSKHYKTTQKR